MPHKGVYGNSANLEFDSHCQHSILVNSKVIKHLRLGCLLISLASLLGTVGWIFESFESQQVPRERSATVTLLAIASLITFSAGISKLATGVLRRDK